MYKEKINSYDDKIFGQNRMLNAEIYELKEKLRELETNK